MDHLTGKVTVVRSQNPVNQTMNGYKERRVMIENRVHNGKDH